MNKFQINQCPYCGSQNLGKGYQAGYGAVTSCYHIFKSSKILYIICTDCGSIVHSYVNKPESFRAK